MANNKDIAVYQPVINGVGGNLVSVQASRLSTELHKESELGVLPPSAGICISPIDAFFSKKPYAMTARVLMLLVVPGHLTFLHTITYLKGDDSPSALFFVTYLTAVLVQVAILLYVAYVITYYFWSHKIDPDNSTIPYLTALGDLLGIILLVITFEILSLIGDRKTDSE